MGVLACDRCGCGNIMCDRLSHFHGYICNECFSELCESGMQPQDFMDSTKGELTPKRDLTNWYNQIFPIQE